MLKEINGQTARIHTPQSKTEKEQVKHREASASNRLGATPLLTTKSKSEKALNRESESPLNKTSFDVLRSVPFRELLDTQRRHSPVMSHRICGVAPFTGVYKDEPERDTYLFQQQEGKSLRKNGLFYCNSPLCLWCETKRRKDKQEEFELVLTNSSKEKVFGTFTAKTSSNLSGFADKMTDAFARTISSLMTECEKRYGEKPIYAKVVEITTNPYKNKDGSVHYHLHFIITFRRDLDKTNNIYTLYNLRWMQDFLLTKWMKFGSKVGLVVRKKGQDITLLGTSQEDVARIALYLTKGLAMELTSQQTKESKTNYSLKSLIALVSEGCSQALTLYHKIANSLFGKRFLTKSQGWNDFHRELITQQEEQVSEIVEEEEPVQITELEVDRMFYKAAHLSFGTFGDDLFSYIMLKKSGEDAFERLSLICSFDFMRAVESENADEFGIVDEEAVYQVVKELVLELMEDSRIEREDITGRTFSFLTFETG